MNPKVLSKTVSISIISIMSIGIAGYFIWSTQKSEPGHDGDAKENPIIQESGLHENVCSPLFSLEDFTEVCSIKEGSNIELKNHLRNFKESGECGVHLSEKINGEVLFQLTVDDLSSKFANKTDGIMVYQKALQTAPAIGKNEVGEFSVRRDMGWGSTALLFVKRDKSGRYKSVSLSTQDNPECNTPDNCPSYVCNTDDILEIAKRIEKKF